MEKKSTVQENMSEENERTATAHRTVKMRRLKNFGEDNSARHIIMVIASMLCFFYLMVYSFQISKACRIFIQTGNRFFTVD